MIEKIHNLPIGKILSYFNFYELEASNSYYYFKNAIGYSIILYLPEDKEHIHYFVSHKFKTVSKTDLICFLLEIKKHSLAEVNTILEEIDRIDEFPDIKLFKRRTHNFFIRQLFALTPDPELFENMNENFFIRNGEAAVLLYQNENPIDVLCSTQGSSYTVFENNQGYYLKEGNQDLIISYNPFWIKSQIAHYTSYSILFLPEHYSNIGCLGIEENYTTLHFANNTVEDAYFCLKTIVLLYSKKITLSKSSLFLFQLEIEFDHLEKKMNILQYNSQIQKAFIKNLPSELLSFQTQFLPIFSIEETKTKKVLILQFNYSKFAINTLIQFMIKELNLEDCIKQISI